MNKISRTLQSLVIASALLSQSGYLIAKETLAPEEEKSIQDSFVQMEQEPGAVMFVPPQGWVLADPKALPPSVKIMVVGKGQREFPPSINLATERYNGTLKQYLKTIKAINDSQGAEWKDLGTIRTEAGDASLSQVDSKTEWGDVRMMHVILIKNGTTYILTAASLKDEFSQYYKDFFNSMRSLRINKDAIEMVSDTNRKANLEKAVQSLKQSWQTIYSKQLQENKEASKDQLAQEVFKSPDFQKNQWEPFKAMLVKDYSDMGSDWQKSMLNKVENDLVN